MNYAALRLKELGGKPRRIREIQVPERDVLASVLEFLAIHPKVAWVRRMNVGAMKIGERFMRFGFVGCADIIGQLKDGRFLAIECKASKGKATLAQNDFLDLVNKHGGLGGLARKIEDVERILDRA